MPMVPVNAGLLYIGEVTTCCSSRNSGVDARDDVSSHDNARLHSQPGFLRSRGLVTTFYGRDIAVCDFHLFGPCNKGLAGKRFT
jgi:hypothetical protein